MVWWCRRGQSKYGGVVVPEWAERVRWCGGAGGGGAGAVVWWCRRGQSECGGVVVW